MTRNFSLVSGLSLIMFSAFFFSACSGVSEEQLIALNKKKQEVQKLELQANGLKDERARLEKELAEKNKKIEDCNKLKQEVKANLSQIKK